MITIETMTAGALRRGGLDDVRISLLMRDALRGHGRSRRALERAAGVELELVHHRDPEIRIPLRRAILARKWETAMLSGPVLLQAGMWWDYGTLHGDLPETLRSAIPGRRVGDVIAHPDIPADSMARPARVAGGILSIDPVPVMPASTGAIERIRRLRYRWEMLMEEGRMDKQMPAGIATMLLLLALGSTIMAIMLVSLPQDGWDRIAATTATCVAAVYGLSNALNARRKRPFSILQAIMAETRHKDGLRTVPEVGKGGYSDLSVESAFVLQPDWLVLYSADDTHPLVQ